MRLEALLLLVAGFCVRNATVFCRTGHGIALFFGDVVARFALVRCRLIAGLAGSIARVCIGLCDLLVRFGVSLGGLQLGFCLFDANVLGIAGLVIAFFFSDLVVCFRFFVPYLAISLVARFVLCLELRLGYFLTAGRFGIANILVIA